jgi:hypothetical protein
MLLKHHKTQIKSRGMLFRDVLNNGLEEKAKFVYGRFLKPVVSKGRALNERIFTGLRPRSLRRPRQTEAGAKPDMEKE